MRRVSLLLLLTGASCQGPAVDDQTLCEDVIHRLCLPPVCPQVAAAFPVDFGCEDVLRQNSGCAADGFTFTKATRERVLSCRLFLVRTGENVESKPHCDNVEEMFSLCPDVVQFLEDG